MTVLTGRSGQLIVSGIRVARCTGWSLDESRPMLDVTPVDSWDRQVIPGRRSGEGAATMLYDPSDTAAVGFFESVLLNSTNLTPVTLLLDSLTGEGLPLTVHVSSASHAVSRGEAQLRDISFRLSDITIELEIIGNEGSSVGLTQLYTAALYGAEGAWTFLWVVNGATIADPTAQSTNITFSATGTYTVSVTATLGATVLTAELTVVVSASPLLWLTRATSAIQTTTQGSFDFSSSTAMNKSLGIVYHSAAYRPDASLGSDRVLLSRITYAGAVTAVKQILGAPNSASPVFMEVLNDGTIFMVLQQFFNQPTMLKISADLSTILWKFNYGGGASASWGSGTYDPATDRIYFEWQFAASPWVGFVEMGNGAMTRVVITANPAHSNAGRVKPLITSAGTVLFALCSSTNKVTLMEFNKSLTAGATKTVEHTFTTGSPVTRSGVLIESANYYALACAFSDFGSNLGISLYDKTSLAFVSGRLLGNQPTLAIHGPPLGNAFFAGSEFIFITGRSGSSGIAVSKVSENLGSATSYYSLNSSELVGLRSENNIAFDSGLGVVAIGASGGSGIGREYCIFGRVGYDAAPSLTYRTGPDIILTTSPLGNPPNQIYLGTVAVAPTTVNRSFSYASNNPVGSASSVTISDEIQITLGSFVLASP